MENSKEKKDSSLSFIKRFIMSIKDIDKYSQIGAEKITKSLEYIIELLLIFSIILTIAITYKANNFVAQTCEFIKNELPDFEIKDNQLNINLEQPIRKDIDEYIKLRVIIDNTENADNYSETITNYDGNVILFLKDEVYYKYASGLEKTETYDELITDYNITDANKSGVINKIQSLDIKQIAVGIFVAIFIVATITTMINVLALSLLGIIVAKLARANINYRAIFNMSISAITFPTILSLIFFILWFMIGFSMPYLQMMYTIISYIYLIAAILIIKSDKNKTKQEIVTTIQIDKLQREEKHKEEQDKKPEEKPEEKQNEKNENKGDTNTPKDKENGKKKKGQTKGTPNPEPQENIKANEVTNLK